MRASKYFLGHPKDKYKGLNFTQISVSKQYLSHANIAIFVLKTIIAVFLLYCLFCLQGPSEAFLNYTIT